MVAFASAAKYRKFKNLLSAVQLLYSDNLLQHPIYLDAKLLTVFVYRK